MDVRNLIKLLLHMLVGVAMAFSGAAIASDLAMRSSEDGGVTIAVKPIQVSADVKTWSFEVSLSSSGPDLRDDLVRTAYIVNRAGKRDEPPIGWDGDAPRGRERKGVLRFKPLTPLPAAIELQIQRVGETAPRVFRWDLDCPCKDPTMHSS